ncbi:MAG: DUF1292 domain-containing protein [Lachnospiraceae bacterium]|nr:DUF1292 domain-containing protein [Lachnospiraceae bacterium]
MSVEKKEKITMTGESGEDIELYILAETTIQGKSYILVSDSESDEDIECDIMVKLEGEDSEYCTYEFVDDEAELSSVFKVFEALMED